MKARLLAASAIAMLTTAPAFAQTVQSSDQAASDATGAGSVNQSGASDYQSANDLLFQDTVFIPAQHRLKLREGGKTACAMTNPDDCHTAASTTV